MFTHTLLQLASQLQLKNIITRANVTWQHRSKPHLKQFLNHFNYTTYTWHIIIYSVRKPFIETDYDYYLHAILLAFSCQRDCNIGEHILLFGH